MFTRCLTAIVGVLVLSAAVLTSGADPERQIPAKTTPHGDTAGAIGAPVIPKVVYDGQSFEYEKLRRAAMEAGRDPVPLKVAKTPGELKDGRPWKGTVVWQSHKTNLIIETYADGQRHGPSVGFHSPKVKHWDGNYDHGKKDGVFRIWDAAGQLMETEVYKQGTKVTVGAQDAAKPVDLGDQRTGVDRWGDKEMGLQAKVIGPNTIEQGLPLIAELHLRCDPMKLDKGVRQLNTFMHDAFLKLQLKNRRTGKLIAVKPYDPTAKMPTQDRGNAVERLDGNPIQAWKAQFPLARLYAQLEPGDYDCQIEFTFPNRKTSWWHSDEASWNKAGFWHGTVTSASFRLAVKTQTAKTTTLLLPNKLSLGPELVTLRVDDPRKTAVPMISIRKEDTEKVTFPVRNGHFKGAKYYRDGEFYQLSSPPTLDDKDAVDAWYDYKDGDRKVSYTIEVFETAEQPHHAWHPGPTLKDYKVLWKKTFHFSLTENEIKKVLDDHEQKPRE